MPLENTLKARSITVKKHWNDNGYNGADKNNLHYDIDVKLTSSGANTSDNSKITIDRKSVSENYTIPASGSYGSDNQAVIENVPVYDMSGAVIDYSASERVTGTSSWGSKKYGYIRGDEPDEYYTNADDPNYPEANVQKTLTVTNTLPLTDIEVTKNWDRTVHDYHKYDSGDIKVTLKRNDSNLFTDQTLETTPGQEIGTKTFAAQLRFDENNNAYTYKIEESTYKGFSLNTSSSTQSGSSNNTTSTAATDIALTLNNVPVRGSASFIKIDRTYEDMYGGSKKKTLAGAKFRVYILNDDVRKYCYFSSLGDGKYKFDDSKVNLNDPNESSAVVVTGEGGKLEFTDLPLNTYILEETQAPTGYKKAGDHTFTVDVNDTNAPISNLQLTGPSPDTAVQTGSPYYLRNEQESERVGDITLTKKDKTDGRTITASNATYKLLRLIPMVENSNTGIVKTSEPDYRTAAQNTVKSFNDSCADIDKYWQEVGVYQTENGTITETGLEFGEYVFMEIQPPVGYERDNSNVTFFTIDSTNYTQNLSLDHNDPRKSARVKIFKSDEYGNGLNDAVFDLYKVAESGEDTHIASVKTGDDGMNLLVGSGNVTDFANYTAYPDLEGTAIVLKEWGDYYFVERDAPYGYTMDKTGEDNKFAFTVDSVLADKVIHIVRANDSRIKGKVTLTKISSERFTKTDGSIVNIGDKLEGAQFKLFKLNDSGSAMEQIKVTKDDPTNTYTANGTAAAEESDSNILTTGADGMLRAVGLEWGRYVLKETRAPGGYVEDGGDVYFSVGRNNVGSGDNEFDQHLVSQNKSEKAHITITKTLTGYRTNWGTPAFIFKIRQKSAGSYTGVEKTVSLQITNADDPTNVTSLDVEPGEYEVSEIRAARYSVESSGYTITNADGTNGPSVSVNSDAVTFTVNADQTANVSFTNKISYYDKFSHTDEKVNTFNGYKALNVKINKTLTAADSGENVSQIGDNYYLTIKKTELIGELIKSSGERVDITDKSNIKISYSNNDTVNDSRFNVIDNGSTFQVVCTPIITAGGVYTLNAEYTHDGHKFSTTFDITFTERNSKPKREIQVVFSADTNKNRAYFNDSGKRTNTYEYTFVLIDNTIYEIKHNGVTVNDSGLMNAVNDALNINSALNDKLAFNGEWLSADLSDDEKLKNAVCASGSASINYTAKITDKTP